MHAIAHHGAGRGDVNSGLAPVTTPAAIGWAACGTQLECARVSIPLDWARHGGRVITLSVIRHLASHPGRRIGSLFVDPDFGQGAAVR
jgi:hypothetical protein